MKKIVLSLLALAATMNIMAVTYSAKATITLESKSNYESCQIIIGESDELVAGLNNGEYAEINMDGRSVALYVEYDGVKYQHFASNPATMKNLTLKAKTNAAENYNLIISDVTGSFTLKLGDAEPVAIAAGTQVIALNKNDEYAIGVINYDPTPVCTEIRTGLVVDHYYTICLDKEVASFSGASFWNMSKRGTDVAYLEEVQAPLEAGKPYIFQAEDDALCVIYGDGVAATAGTNGALVGTFDDMDQAALSAAASAAASDIYLLYNNELWNATMAGASGNSLAAAHAYVVYSLLSQEAPAPGRRVRAIPMQGQTATDIEAINASEAPAKTFIDGKLFIIRGEQMFDATGRLVK